MHYLGDHAAVPPIYQFGEFMSSDTLVRTRDRPAYINRCLFLAYKIMTIAPLFPLQTLNQPNSMTSKFDLSAYDLSDIPAGFDARVNGSGKVYYVNHRDRTTSWRHPRHTHLHEPYTPGLPYPHERAYDEKGRAYYLDREAKTTSWLHPGKLMELKENGVLDKEDDDNEARKEYIVMETAEEPNKGRTYWMNYKEAYVDWLSPEERRAVRRKVEEREKVKLAEKLKKTSLGKAEEKKEGKAKGVLKGLFHRARS